MTPPIPLAMVSEGTETKVAGINASRSLADRLKAMGFIENCPLKVTRDHMGSLIVEISGCKYALGKGMASKILVRPIN